MKIILKKINGAIENRSQNITLFEDKNGNLYFSLELEYKPYQVLDFLWNCFIFDISIIDINIITANHQKYGMATYIKINSVCRDLGKGSKTKNGDLYFDGIRSLCSKMKSI